MKLNWIKYLLLIGFFAFLFYSLLFYSKIHHTISNKLLPVQACAYKIQNDIGISHLWLEEFLEGDSTINVYEDILEPITNAEKYAFALLNGQSDVPNLTLTPIQDSLYQALSDIIVKDVIELKEQSLNRIKHKETAYIGSSFDQEYDKAFWRLNNSLEKLRYDISTKLAEEYNKNDNTKNVLFFFSSILGAFVILSLALSDRRRNRIALEKDNQKSEMAQILNEAPVGIFHFDRNYIITDCNPKLAQMVGSPMEDVIGLDLVNDLKEKRIGEACKQTFLTGHALFEDIYHSSLVEKSTPVIIEFKALKNKVGHYYSGIGLMRDMTEEYEAKKELRESEEKFRSISDLANDMIIMMDDRGNIEYWNQSAESILGYGKEEVLGKKLHNLIAPTRYHNAHHQAFSQWVKTGEGAAVGKTLELEAIHKEGHEIVIELSLSSIKLKDEWHAIGIIRDITERKQYTKELIEAKEKAEESDRLKTAFLSNISHEIRTPMNGIIGFADLLKDPNIQGDQLRYFIEIIENSSNRMLNIINDIIVISKIEAGDVQFEGSDVDVLELISGSIEKLKPEVEEKGLYIHLHSTLKPTQSIIKSDYEKLHHVFQNILKNAIKFTHKGGIDCSLAIEGKKLVMDIKDTGIGIAKEMQDIIFDRFRQVDSSKNRAYEGAGLGLSISKAYIEVLGGELKLASIEGEGTTFSILLPFEEKDDNDKPESSAKNDVVRDSNEKLTILIAEDEYPSYVLLNEYLSYLDAKIVHAQDGVEALTYIKNNHVDLILMDLKMPNMDGYKAIPLIKAEKPNIPIIAQTAYAMSGDEEKALQIGSDDYIRKPIDERVLKVKLKRHLGF